jgi:hypothetical protein
MKSKLSLFERIVIGLPVGGGVLLLVGLLWWWFAPDRWVYKGEFEMSESIIQVAESYRAMHGYVPTEEEIAVAGKKAGRELSERCPCYQRVGNSDYVVWFGYQTVGTSMVYRSKNKEWQPEG